MVDCDRYRLLYFLLFIFISTSCSFLPTGSRPIVDSGSSVGSPGGESVPKAQYEQLLKKYQLLVEQQEGEQAVANRRPVVAIDKGPKQTKIESDIFANEDPSKIIEKISKAAELKKKRLVETVNLLDAPKGPVDNRKELISPATPSPLSGVAIKLGAKEKRRRSDLVESQIAQLRKGIQLFSIQRHNDAQKLFKQLQSSPVDQIRVRAKFMEGEILFNQEEYDLSMQIYNDVIKRHAFSGYALKSLQRLITCSEKMKLAGKREQYHSLLYDFFGQVDRGKEE
jgi:TolA-binding protein